jgi:hypothetical protein
MFGVAGRILLLLALLMASAPAHAQEGGNQGLVVGYPANIGLLWHATERVAVRPEVSFAFSSNEVTTTTSPLPEISAIFGETAARTVVTEGRNTAVSVGTSVLWYVSDADNLRTYLSPRFIYTRSTAETAVSPSFVGGSSLEGWNAGVAVSYGLQYALHPRFGLFGEAGVGYSYARNSSATSELRGHQLNGRSGVGIILYFRN